MNQLFYGDNLAVMRDHVKDESVDLVYLDPPFNSRADSHVRDLRGVLDREKADIGVLITLEGPSKQMVKEAASAGFYKSPAFPDQPFPRMQILTIEEMLEGKGIEFPRLLETTFKQAPKAKAKAAENLTLDL